MNGICIITKDERLKHQLALLVCERGYTVIKSGSPLLYIVDGDTASAFRAPDGARVLSVSREGGKGVLRRPFTYAELYAAIDAALESDEGSALSETEKRLLSLLKEARGEPLSREALIRGVWGDGGSDGLLSLYVHYLRQKLEKDGRRRIFSARGKGYFYKC